MRPMELRPRTVGEILDLAFKLYTSHIRKLLIIAAVVFIPIGMIQLFVAAGSGIDTIDLFDPEALASGELPAGFISFLGGTLALSLISLIGTLFVQGAAIKLFAGAFQGIEQSWQDSVRFGIDKSLLILGTAIMAALGSGIGLIFFLAPGIWLWTSWYVAIPALLVEGTGPMAALGRSFQLVKQRFWPVLGVGALAWLISQVVVQFLVLVIDVVAVVPAAMAAAETGTLDGGVYSASVLASSVASIVTVPFLAAVAVAVYFDLRVRFEGFDLETLARQSDNLEIPP
ncbi:MAG: hypothetical protein WEA76_06295, partial [Acidimicrobiia bacterium]